jgi:hypothetical protein
VIAGAPEERQQFLLQRLQQSTDGWSIPLELAAASTCATLIQLVQGLHQLVHRILDPLPIAQRQQRRHQRATHIILTLAVRQTVGERFDESASRLERVRIFVQHEETRSQHS